MNKLTIICLLGALCVAQGMDMRGLKARNAAYLKRTTQTQMTQLTPEKLDQARRHVLEAGLEETFDNVAAAHRTLSYFNESKWQEADSWVDPALSNDMSFNQSACPGQELYGPFGNQYICPLHSGVDCALESDQYAKMDEEGNPEDVDGVWYVMPTAMRGNWAEADYWTVPFTMGKFISDFESLCEAGDAFNTETFPSCIRKGIDRPFATMCVFSRMYTLDYAALWYLWLAWRDYADSAELITRSANIDLDGYESTTLLYQARFFVPAVDGSAARKLLQEDDETSEDDNTSVSQHSETNILATSAKGGDLEKLQNKLDSSALGGSPTLVMPPPTPALDGICVGNCTNSTPA